MNCQLARNRMLAVEEPESLPDELAAHLDDCAACRSWRRNYLLLDKALASIPVPEADGMTKIAVLERVRATPAPKRTAEPKKAAPKVAPVMKTPVAPPIAATSPAANHRPMPVRLEEDLPPKKRIQLGHYAAKFWPAGLVAATLLVGTIAWLSLRGGGQPSVAATPADPMLDSLVSLNVKLAKSDVPKERVAVLAQIADEVNREMRDIARADATGDNMQALEEMYRKVVLNGLVSQAKLLDRSDKSQREILGKVADGLAQSGQRAEQMAAESPQHSAERLREAATTAREGTKRIRNLIKGA
jgi:hypothetical protein